MNQDGNEECNQIEILGYQEFPVFIGFLGENDEFGYMIVSKVVLEVVYEVTGLFPGERVGAASLDRFGPDLDEALEGVVRDQILTVKNLHGGRTGVVAAVQPPLDAAPVVRNPGAQAHRGFHHVQRDGAPEKAGHTYVQIVPHI